MNRTNLTQQAETSSFLPPVQGILQRKCACGNKTVASGECAECAKKKNCLQHKLTIGASNDPLEREADRVADQVMAMSTNSSIGKTPPRIQRFTGQSTGQSNTTPASVDRVLASSGRPMEPVLRQDMEQRFGHDFSQVRVHSGVAAEQSAMDVSAHAYTVGNNVVFGARQFAPGTYGGRRLLAHELTHVVQQSGTKGNYLPLRIDKHGLSPVSYVIQQQSSGSSHLRSVENNVRSPSSLIQRKKRGAAGGCGICLGPRGKLAGGIAHKTIQLYFESFSILSEQAVPTVEKGETAPFIPRTDLSFGRSELGQKNIYIGEIKPLDDAKKQAKIGRNELKDYYAALKATNIYDEIFRMKDPPPPQLPFVNLRNPSGCPKQKIKTKRTEPGLYQYICDPPWSELVKNPKCKCIEKKKKKSKKKGKGKTTKPNTKKAGKGIGKGLKKGAKKGFGKAVVKGVLKKFIPGEALLEVGMLITVLAAGAKPSFGGDGMSLEEAFLDILENGTVPDVEISDELLEILTSDSDLSDQMRQLEKGEGDQDAIVQEMINLLEDNKDLLDEETLEILVEGMEKSPNTKVKQTSEEFRKVLEKIKGGAKIGESGEGTSESEQAKPSSSGKTKKGRSGDESGKGRAGEEITALDPELKKQIEKRPSIKKLFDAVKAKEGIEISEEFVRLMLDAAKDLTDEQLEEKIKQIKLLSQPTDESVENALIELIKQSSEATKQAQKVKILPPSRPTDAQIKNIKKDLKKFKGKQNIVFFTKKGEKIVKGSKFNGTFINNIKANGNRFVGARVRLIVSSVAENNAFTVTIIGSTLFIDVRGNIVNEVQQPVGKVFHLVSKIK